MEQWVRSGNTFGNTPQAFLSRLSLRLIRNVTAGSEVVPPTPSNGISITAPNYDLYSENIRCGRDGHLHGKGTQTATVVAGSEIGMRIRDWDVSCLSPSVFSVINAPNVLMLTRSNTARLFNLSSRPSAGLSLKIAYAGPRFVYRWWRLGRSILHLQCQLCSWKDLQVQNKVLWPPARSLPSHEYEMGGYRPYWG